MFNLFSVRVKINGRLKKHNRYGYVENVLFQPLFIKKYKSVKDLYHDYKTREEEYEEPDDFTFWLMKLIQKPS